MNKHPELLSYHTGMQPLAPKFMSSPLLVDNTTAIGIEIELENFAHYHNIGLSFWTAVSDGSLRNNGIEFISGCNTNQGTVPIVGENIILALDEFKKCIEYNASTGKVKPELSQRCSVHIHVDVREMKLVELYRFILLYTMFEKPIFRFCGERREKNAYCIPIKDNYGLQSKLTGLIKDGNSSNAVISAISAGTKYDAMNICSIREKGSVEFRMHPGCIDVDRLLVWINILLSLKVAAKNLVNMEPSKVPEYYSSNGFLEFTQSIFSNDLFEVLKYEGIEYDVIEGMRLCQVIEHHEMLVSIDNTIHSKEEAYKSIPVTEHLLYPFSQKVKKEITYSNL